MASRVMWPLALYRVAGHSMLPTYRPGDTLLGWRWLRPRRLKPATVVVAEQAGRPVIKRLTGHTAAGLSLAGDNPSDSLDSRQLGTVPPASIKAVIIWRLPG